MKASRVLVSMSFVLTLAAGSADGQATSRRPARVFFEGRDVVAGMLGLRIRFDEPWVRVESGNNVVLSMLSTVAMRHPDSGLVVAFSAIGDSDDRTLSELAGNWMPNPVRRGEGRVAGHRAAWVENEDGRVTAVGDGDRVLIVMCLWRGALDQHRATCDALLASARAR